MTNRLKLFPGLAVIKQMILAFGGGKGRDMCHASAISSVAEFSIQNV